jgi:hypothetical protein
MPDDAFQLTLHALPDAVPPTKRLAMALKCLLRSYRLRCTDARRVCGESAKELLLSAGGELNSAPPSPAAVEAQRIATLCDHLLKLPIRRAS